jgi:hypothetical protein
MLFATRNQQEIKTSEVCSSDHDYISILINVEFVGMVFFFSKTNKNKETNKKPNFFTGKVSVVFPVNFADNVRLF